MDGFRKKERTQKEAILIHQRADFKFSQVFL